MEVAVVGFYALIAWLWWLLLHDEPDPDLNPYARMLGKVVEVKKHPASDWEPCIVVAVSWHGGLRVRRLSEIDEDGHGNGFWIDKTVVRERVRWE